MKGPVQSTLRKLTRVMRPIALRTAGKPGKHASVVRHTGRTTGHGYETPVVAVEHGDEFLIALPYGPRTDWLRNVLTAGSASVVTAGHTYAVDHPEVVPIAEATGYFGAQEQRLHRRFHVETALKLHRITARSPLRADPFARQVGGTRRTPTRERRAPPR